MYQNKKRAILVGFGLCLAAWTSVSTVGHVPVRPVNAAGACPGGGTATTIVSGLEAITGGSTLDRTDPANLVANGDFTTEPTGLSSSSYPDRYYWAQGGLTLKNGVTATNSAIPSWSRSGGTASTYAFWTKQLSGNSNSLIAPASNGQSSGRVYFGNGIVSTITPLARFDSNGFSTESYTFTPGAAYGTNEDPPALNQTVTLVAGEKYRMYFLQSTENMLVWTGIAALEITGYQRIYFEVATGNRGYMVEFTAASSATNIKFLSWGHLSSGMSQISTVTNRSAGGTYVTLTTSSAHGYSAGQQIAVTGVGDRYDTTLTSVFDAPTTTTFRYIKTGSTETSTASSGTVYVPTSGLSSEFVLDDVIINACSASGVPARTAAPGTTPVSETTAVPGTTPVSETTAAPGTTIATGVGSTPGKISAVDDAQTTAWDTNQTYEPLVNDSASPGATIVTSSLKLCAKSVKAPYTKSKCTVSSVTVAGEGVYTLKDGKVLFDPYPTFSGTVKFPVHYVYVDSSGASASAKITPTIGKKDPAAAPTPTISAIVDAQTTAWDTNQTYEPLVNDSASPGATIVTSSLKLCAKSVKAPYTKSKCTVSSVTVAGEGVYTLKDGKVLFDPYPTFSGTVKFPVHYVYVDSSGASASAKITPTIGEIDTDLLPQSGSNSALLFELALMLLLVGFLASRARPRSS